MKEVRKLKSIELNFTSSIIFALVASLGIYLSFPRYDYWYFSFFTFSIFSYFYLRLSEKKSLHSVRVFFIFTFVFWFCKRSIEFESIYFTAINYFKNTTVGIVFTISLFCILAFYSATLHCLSLALLYGIKRKYLRYFLIIIIFIILGNLNNVFLPNPSELVMYQNRYLMASLNFFSLYYYKAGFYLSCLLIAIHFQDKKKLFTVFIIVFSWLIISATVGWKMLKQSMSEIPINIILVQTDQSVLFDNEKNIDFYFEELVKSIKKNFKKNDQVYVFWPESFMEDSPENLRKIISLQNSTQVSLLHLIGLYKLTEAGIINKMTLISNDGSIANAYFKNHLFPIGEESLSLPLIPNRWTKVNIPVLNSKIVKSFSSNGINFLPLICYESVIDEHYKKLQSLSKGDGKDIFVNLSKDSYYEGTSLIKLHSIYARIKSSSMKIPMIRVTTTENSEIISPQGEVLQRSHKGIFEIITRHVK